MNDEEAIRNAFAAWNDGGVDAFLEHVSPGIEWRHPPGFPQGDVWRGRKELRREMQDQFEDVFSTGSVEVKSIEPAPEGWLVGARHSVQARSSGMDLWWDAWFIWTIEDGLITRSQVFLNRGAAERAAGVVKHGGD